MSNEEQVIVITPDNKYIALLDFDDTLAPLVASAELTKDYLLADRIFKKLLEETVVEQYEDKNGATRESTRFHPDLKWWFEQKTKIQSVIAKLNMQGGIKEGEMAFDLMKILLQDKEILTPEQRRMVGKELMKRRMRDKSVDTDPISERD